MDSNLFKEAIAEARAVRQQAIANANNALEEAFTERYKAMFAEKLKQEPEECVSEPEIDELIKELEAEYNSS